MAIVSFCSPGDRCCCLTRWQVRSSHTWLVPSSHLWQLTVTVGPMWRLSSHRRLALCTTRDMGCHPQGDCAVSVTCRRPIIARRSHPTSEMCCHYTGDSWCHPTCYCSAVNPTTNIPSRNVFAIMRSSRLLFPSICESWKTQINSPIVSRNENKSLGTSVFAKVRGVTCELTICSSAQICIAIESTLAVNILYYPAL